MPEQPEYIPGSSDAERERLIRQSAAHEPEATWLLDQIGVRPGWCAVDVGCGPLGILDLLSPRVGVTGAVTGLDNEPRMLELARRSVAELGLQNVQLVRGEAASSGLPRASFDCAHARLVLINVPNPEAVLREMTALVDKLTWKWIKGDSTTAAELADPLSSATYELCMFAGTASAVIGSAVVSPDAQKWRTIGSASYMYEDDGGTQDGIRKILLKSSDTDRAKIILKGKGANLPDPHPELPLPITVQLRNTESNVCWSASYDSADINRTGKLKAKTLSP